MWPKWVGHSLGRYTIEELRGRGAMGVVLRATDPELQRIVAIKIIYPNLTSDEELVERFRVEARTAANLHHRNIVAIYDVGYAEDLYFIVMEYLDGPSLETVIIEKGALPPEQVLAIGEQMAAALDHIHRQKLVHRDVKSTNIIIDPDGRAVLTDFGLVMTSKGSTVTSEGKIIGTPQYMAPEQITGREIGPWTDLYALAVVTYHMLTGELPFSADSPAALLFQVLWQPAPAASSVKQGLPTVVDEVFKRALAKEPEERYPNGAAFVTALRQAMRGEAPQEAAAPPPARARPIALPPLRAWPSWLWATAGAIVLLLITGPLLALGTGLFSGTLPTATPPQVALNETPSLVPLPTTQPPLPTTQPPLPTATSPPPSAVPSVPPPTVTPTPPLPTETSPPTVPPTPLPTVTSTPTPVPTSAPTSAPTARPVRPTTRPPTAVPPTPVPPTATWTPPPPTEPPPTEPPPTEPPPTEPPPTEPPPTETPTPMPTPEPPPPVW